MAAVVKKGIVVRAAGQEQQAAGSAAWQAAGTAVRVPARRERQCMA